MHSHENKMRTIELYLRYNRSATPVINDSGYPNRCILRLWHRKLEVSRDAVFRYLTTGRPPYIGRLHRTPKATRSTVARNRPSPSPKPHRNSLPQASHRRFQTRTQTRTSNTRPHSKQPLGKQPQTAAIKQQAITSLRSQHRLKQRSLTTPSKHAKLVYNLRFFVYTAIVEIAVRS